LAHKNLSPTSPAASLPRRNIGHTFAALDPVDAQQPADHPGGYLVFETRDPACRAWRGWNRAASYSVTEIDGIGAVESWHEVTDVTGSLVSFRSTTVFASDGELLTSDSTLRFRGRDEVQTDLVAHGYVIDDVRGAPDRPGREFVFFARRPG
jgi:hypothetical protein